VVSWCDPRPAVTGVLSSSSSTGWGLSTDRFGRLRAPRCAGLLVFMNLFNRVAQRIQEARNDLGMTTAEYAVGTVAAVAFAAVLYKVVRSPAVQSAVSSIITSALNVSL
jgi:hypothetical protein